MSARLRGYIRHHHVGLVALFFALSGGVAWATHPGGANTINSTDIIDGQVRTADIGNGEVRIADIGQAAVGADELAANSVAAGKIIDAEVKVAEIATGAVRTEELANGQVQAEDLAPGVAPGASGARAWGLVASFGDLLRSENVTDADRVDDGLYCIDPGSGIDPDTAVMVVGEEKTWGDTSDTTHNVSLVEWDSTPSDCPAGEMEVQTFIGNGSLATGGETDSGGFHVSLADQGFTFVIP